MSARSILVAIALSAFPLFLVQPIIAKQLLAWFGGSSAVWITCLVFFQVMLLASYTYAHFMTTCLRSWWQGSLHIAMLLASLLFGVLWNAFGATVAFGTGAALALVATVLLFGLVRR